MLDITPERPQDAAEIETLLDAAFGPDRRAKISYRYRQDVPPVAALSRVIRQDGRLVGTIRYWPIRVGEPGTPALLLGPLGIAPDCQGRGVGRALVFATLEAAAGQGHRLVLLVGDLPYYRRFGFAPVPPGVFMPDEKPERLLGRELVPDAWAGVAGPVRRWSEAAARPRRRRTA